METIITAGVQKRNIILLLQGHFISKLGTALFDIALVLWLKEKTGLASVVGVVMMLAHLPQIILSPLSGTLVDMSPRKMVLVFSDLIVGLLIVCIGALFFIPDISNTAIFAMLIIGSICIGICDSFFNPAVSSFIPELVVKEKLQKANSTYRFLTSAATFIGQSIGGVLFTILGAKLLFIINGISYLVSAGSECCIVTPIGDRSTARLTCAEVLGNMKRGFLYIWNNGALKSFLFVLCLYHFFISPFTVILPFYVSDILNKSAAWYGYFMASFGIGLLAGFIISGSAKFYNKNRAILVTSCFFIASLCFVGIGIVNYTYTTLFFLFMIGASLAVIVVNLNTIIQLTTPNTMHGRIFGLYNTISTASIPVGMGFFGIILDSIHKISPKLTNGPALIFTVSGIVLCVISLFFITKDSFRSVLVSK
jgi:MFS transporter, DHA3 family, macrolide efflux protein